MRHNMFVKCDILFYCETHKRQNKKEDIKGERDTQWDKESKREKRQKRKRESKNVYESCIESTISFEK